ncbi:site-specific integrase [Bacillus chungangensis]|uniref:Site-specific recombinase XerD n=1 Tax=Bacillus chungangensis TaxID=587633 RepID=A0ABT9WVA4_9BACI|nr:site-specific integrase [Bacillus chungangensis]MDQ0177149.1 site-specific recombinase XerD [Bacillus chungangensis]
MDILQGFSQWLIEEGWAKKTIDSYVSDIKGYMQYCNEKGDGDQPLLSRFLFVKYKEHLIEHDYAVSTINKKINSLKVFNDFLCFKQQVNQIQDHLL